MGICGICFEETCFSLNGCKHHFCSSCIEEWYLRSNSIDCPTCRQPHIDGYEMLIELRCGHAYDILKQIEVNITYTHLKKRAFKKEKLIWKPYGTFEDAMKDFKMKAIEVVDFIHNTMCQHINVTRQTYHHIYTICDGLTGHYLENINQEKNKGYGALRYYSLCMYFKDLGVQKKWWNHVEFNNYIFEK